ncbi:GLPGLI family protein [Epilithonimonas hispanica]|nr:GLPGLI family protein [Epilithonimonas hispanica]
MKNHYLLILVLLSNFIFGQNKQFLYEYKFIPDSTNKADIKREIMVLNIQKDRSEYYSSVRYESDSTQYAAYQKGINSMPPGNPLVNEWVTKYPNSNQLVHTVMLMSDKYKVKQDVELNWKLTNEFSKILNYNVQKATTEFGGRKWTAWFTKDIPIQDGPYKFKGLPGLILKIEDSNKSHVWELKGIRSNQEPFVYPDLNNYRIIQLNYNQFVKKFKDYRQDPTADLVGQIPDQHDWTGKWRTSAEIIKEMNTEALERLAKDNNLIEINLLK